MSRNKQKKTVQSQIGTMDKNIPNPLGLTTDAFVNYMARMGNGSQNLTEGAEYPLTRLTRNYQLMNSLYRSHWLIRRIIDVIPQDMMKNWINIQSAMKPEDMDKVEKIIRRQRIKSKLLEAMKWARLYGGAACIIMIEGQDNREDLLSPLNVDDVVPGSFKGLMVVDRWSGITPELELIEDINDPDFGLPEFYQIRTGTQANNYFRIHHSRLIRFIGRDLPFWERQAEIYWGASEVEHVFDELKKRDNTSWNIASLIFRANINVMKMEGLGQMLALGDETAKGRVYAAMSAQNQLMSNTGLFVMDREDDFDTKQYSFGGLGEIYELFMMDIAGAAEIPVTKLFGRSPSGMNATGESDLQNYYDMISEKQEDFLRPALDKLLPIIMVSELGAIPDDFDYDFNPANTSSDTDKADLGSKITTSVLEVYNAGIISQKTALKELKQMSDRTGLWTNITDDDIDAADDEPKLDEMSEIDGEEESTNEESKQDRGILRESSSGNSKEDGNSDTKRNYSGRDIQDLKGLLRK